LWVGPKPSIGNIGLKAYENDVRFKEKDSIK
jgi:hypothetical protein